MKCFGTRTRARARTGVANSAAAIRPAQRSSVSTSGRGSPKPPVAGSSTIANPARLPLGIRMTSPVRSFSNDSSAAARRCAWPWRARSRSRSAMAIRRAKYSSKSPRWQAISAAIAAIDSELRVTCRASPTTERSAWNCANDDSSRPRARSGPTEPTRLTAMLYEGRKLDRSGYVRVDANPATCRGSTSGDHTTTAWPSTSMPRRPARPVSCVYSPGVMSTWASPLNLTSRSRTTQRAGMLMPRARVSVANTALTRPRTNNSSTTSLNAGSIPAWWAARPRSSPSSHSQ